MPRIDGILNIVVQQDATELRLGSGRVPKLFRLGTPKRFMMPETSEGMLRELLGELFEPELEEELNTRGTARTTYETPTLGLFDIIYTLRFADDDEDDPDEGPPDPASREVVGFDATFRREPRTTGDPWEDEPDFLTMADRTSASADAPAAAPQPAPAGAPGAAFAPPQAVTQAALQHGQAPVASAPVVVHHAAPALRSDAPRPSTALVNLLHRAASLGASDLHLGTDTPPTLRIDGRLRALDDVYDAQSAEELLDGCMTADVVRALDQGRSADLMLDLDALGRFRVNIYRALQGLNAAIRVLSRYAPALDSLDLPVRLHPLLDLANGLVIVTGPTGSGKSTTLAAMVREVLRNRPQMVITLEDPIEYVQQARGGALVRQREVGRHVRDFATGLRDALREDPDLLLVGEMRDLETISLAMTAAETGHLVLASMHSRSAAYAVERIIDAYPPERQTQVRTQLADALKAVVAQRLVPKLGGRGRVTALELMRVNDSIASLIREGKTAQIISAIQAGGADGMIPLERSLADRVRATQIERDDAFAVANRADVLRAYLERRR